MKTNRILGMASIGVMVVALGAVSAYGSDGDKGVETTAGEVQSRTSTAATQPSDDSRLARLLKEASLSPGVREVARMADLGTDASVLTAHVQNSDKAYKLRPEDLNYLREHGVPDSVVTAMIEHGAQLRAKMPPPQPFLPPPQPFQPVQPGPAQPSSTVVYVPSFSQSAPPASTLTIIGRSDLTRGLSYRKYYYSPWHYYSSRGYDTVYASFGGYGRYGYGYGTFYRRDHGYRICH